MWLTAIAEGTGVEVACAVESSVFAEVEAGADAGFDGAGGVGFGFGDGGGGDEGGHAGEGEVDGLEMHS